MSGEFVPRDFVVPDGLVTEAFRLRMLSVRDVEKDFEAVVASADQLKCAFPTWGGWPEGLTIEQNLVDLGWHQKEFQRRRSFAYTVVTLDEAQVIGCVYIYPTERADFDAEVHLWARESAIGEAADAALEAAVMRWIAAEWPFARVAWPGRRIAWADWAAAPRRECR